MRSRSRDSSWRPTAPSASTADLSASSSTALCSSARSSAVCATHWNRRLLRAEAHPHAGAHNENGARGPMDPSPHSRPGGLRLGDVLRRGTLRSLHDVELHSVSLGQRLEAVALDRAVVHEAVFLTAVRGDEAEPLRVVEPLHLALRTHVPLLRKLIVQGAEHAVPRQLSDPRAHRCPATHCLPRSLVAGSAGALT